MVKQHCFPLHVTPNSHVLVMGWDFRAGQYFPKSTQRKNVSLNKGKGRNVKGKEIPNKAHTPLPAPHQKKPPQTNKQTTNKTNCPEVLWEGSSFTHPQGICFAAGKAHYLL